MNKVIIKMLEIRIYLYGKGYVINKFILNIKNTIIFLKRLIALVIS